MRQLLIISPHFPPVNAPDMQRVRMSLPYYRAHGWNPVVLTVHPRRQHALPEPELCRTVPEDIEVVYCGALPQALAHPFGIHNVALRAWAPLFLQGLALLKKRRFDLVFFSTTQFAVYPMGPLWQALTGTPYVIDIQDPWLTDYYYQPGARKAPGGWKFHFSYLQAQLAQEPIYRRAAGFISVSKRYLTDLEISYPWMRDKPRDTIAFGVSETDLQAAKKTAPQPGPSPARPGLVRVVYTGAAGPIMPDALRCLFAGLRLLRQQDPEAAARLRFEFLGTSYAPAGLAQCSVLPVAREEGLADFVSEEPERIGHLDSLRMQAGADVLLLLGSKDLAYSPSKIYPYFLSGKPMLSLAFQGSVLEDLLLHLRCGTRVALRPNAPPEESAESVASALALTARNPTALETGSRNETAFRRDFLAESLTVRQCQIFDQSLTATQKPA
ncbi:MAG: hypothetical protein SFU85_05705 [Candidatus Methylacidiphilales bacterium]|nr:hypothetical protein [Candidatus Methylacidiphilales bacterium]